MTSPTQGFVHLVFNCATIGGEGQKAINTKKYVKFRNDGLATSDTPIGHSRSTNNMPRTMFLKRQAFDIGVCSESITVVQLHKQL